MADERPSELLTVAVDGARCQGHNRCMALCPEVFEADELGYSVVKMDRVPPGLEDEVRLAEASCPEYAIIVT